MPQRIPALAATLAATLALSTALPALAETYVDPDRAWWAAFTDRLDGTTPDPEDLARQDPRYLAADEFSRAAVMAEIATDLAAAREALDPGSAVVVMSVMAIFGDYDSARGGFPVSTFGPSSYLETGSGGLHFRNWQAFNLFPAELDAARALRERIGTDDIVAEVTLEAIRPSTTRRGAYDGHVSGVAYYTRGGDLLGRMEAAPEVVASPGQVADGAAGLRARIEAVAGLPALGTAWDDAKAQLAEGWPLVVSDAWTETATGRQLSHVRRDGTLETDEAPDPAEGFRVYLQQVEGAWLPQDGLSLALTDILGQGGLSTTGLGSGLGCGTPEVPDRCAVLTFAPRAGGHVLTGAHGVIERPGDMTLAEALADLGAGPEVAGIEIMDTLLGYDVEDVRLARKATITGGLGVAARMAVAGGPAEAAPPYDPLDMTMGMDNPGRQVALFALDGAEGRVPVVFVLTE